ncbi:MAG: autotransporter domain-containing protein [Planctomycetaceae bacterium]|nr:autotransporter domain-containing protein [Planctomycetaceae bacterium]
MLGKIKGLLVATLLVAGSMTGVSFAGTIVSETINLGTPGSNGEDWTEISTGVIINQGYALTSDGTVSNVNVGTAPVGTTAGTVGNLIFRDGNTLSNTGSSPLTFTNISNTGQALMQFEGNGVHTISGDIDASKQGTNLYGFDLVASGNINMDDANLKVDNFTQNRGSILNTGSASSIESTGTALIRGNSVFGVNGTFAGGATFTNGATLLGTDNTIDVGANLLNLDSANIDLRDGSLTVSGTLEVTGNSTMTFGAVANGLLNYDYQVLSAGRTMGNLSSTVALDKSYTTALFTQGDQTKTVINGTVDTQSWLNKNVFGDYLFEGGPSGLLVTYTTSDITDVATVRNQLAYNWDSQLITNGMAADVSKVAQQMVAGTPSYANTNSAASFNYAFLGALANNDRTFGITNSTGKTILAGTLDLGMVSAYNGANQAGVIYTAQDVSRDVSATISSRLEAYRAVVQQIGSDSALGSAADILNDRYLNRVWASGIGSWSDADKRKGFEGYKYNGKGVMLGYDKAFCATIFGISAAYIEGDYEDKSASSHDSKIKNYAVNAYMTYNGSTGFFATVSGGWVYSDNDIRENRGGLWATEDYHTNTWHAEAKLGYDIQPCDNWSISPSVGVNFIHAKANSHDLKVEGINGAVRNYSSAKNHMVEIPVEIQAAYEMPLSDITSLTVMGNVGYAYNLNDHAVRGTSSTIGIPGVTPSDIVGRKLGHHSWKAGVGAKLRHDNWDLGVKYDYYGRDKYQNHRVMGTIGYSF